MGNKKIVLIEDDEDHRNLIKEALNEREFAAGRPEVVEFSEGDAALNYLKSSDGDEVVAIVDYTLAGKNGVDVTAEIRKEFPKIPIIGLSASEDMEIQQKFLQAGASLFLVKTIESYKDMAVMLENLFENYEKKVNDEVVLT